MFTTYPVCSARKYDGADIANIIAMHDCDANLLRWARAAVAVVGAVVAGCSLCGLSVASDSSCCCCTVSVAGADGTGVGRP